MAGMPADGAEVAQDVIVKRRLAIRRVVQAEELDRGAVRDLKQVLLIGPCDRQPVEDRHGRCLRNALDHPIERLRIPREVHIFAAKGRRPNSRIEPDPVTANQVRLRDDLVFQPCTRSRDAGIQNDEDQAVSSDFDPVARCVLQEEIEVVWVFHPIERRHGGNARCTDALSAGPRVEENADPRPQYAQPSHDVGKRVSVGMVETVDHDDIAMRDQVTGYDAVENPIVRVLDPKSM
jgi:hypothetical protein